MPLKLDYSNVETILSTNRHYHVPRFQRVYEWTTAQMEQLLEDLFDAFKEKQGDPNHQYFLGSFIFHRTRDGYQIVDGQQRLTSLSIILALARDRIAEDAKLKEEIDSWITNRARKGGAPPRQRLELHRGDEEFYNKYIVPVGATAAIGESPLPDEQPERMRQNTLCAKRRIDELGSEDAIRNFVNYVTTGCHVIEVTLDAEDDPFRIFSTINGRGQPLREVDVLRVVLIEFATGDEAKRRTLLSRWDKTERDLGREAFDDFIEAWRFIWKDGVRKRAPLHKEVLDGLGNSPDRALAFLDGEFAATASIFAQIANCTLAGRKSKAKAKCEAVLWSLSLVDFDEWMPICMFFIRQHGSNFDQLLPLLKKLDRLTWLYYLNREDRFIALHRRSRFASVLKQIGSVDEFDPAKSSIELKDAEKAELRKLFSDEVDPNWVPLKNLLLRLEQILHDGKPIDHLKEGFSIEHILPKSPESTEWFSKFDGKQTTVRDYAFKLGNLCLVTKAVNYEMGNLPFQEKREIALERDVGRHSQMAKAFSEETDWTKDIIDRRTITYRNILIREFDVSLFQS